VKYQYGKNEFSKKYQYGKNEFSKECQYGKKEFSEKYTFMRFWTNASASFCATRCLVVLYAASYCDPGTSLNSL
jgi:hypothetical protein